MKLNFKIFNQIAQLLVFEKLSQLNIQHGEITPFAFSHDIENEEGLYKTFWAKFFLGLKSEIDIEEVIKSGIIVKTKDVYWIDPEDENEEIIRVDIEVENGETIYIDNGYEVYPLENELIYKYKMNKEILKEAKDIYNSCENFITNEKNIFTFTENGIKYEVPIYAIVLLNALHKNKDKKHHMLNLTQSKDEMKKVILKIKDVSILIHVSNSAKKIETQDWKETIKFIE